jgi:hypothetical protein
VKVPVSALLLEDFVGVGVGVGVGVADGWVAAAELLVVLGAVVFVVVTVALFVAVV